MHLHSFSLANNAFNDGPSNSQSRCFREEQRFELLCQRRTRENTHETGRAIFFHLDRRHKDVERTGRHQAFLHVAECFAADIVKIGLKQRHQFCVGLSGGLSDKDPQHVGPFREFHSSAATADGFDSHGGERSESVSQRLDDCGPGRRGEFRRNGHAGEWNSFENLCGAGCGDGADPMIDSDKTTAWGHGIADHTFDLQQIECDSDADNIHDRIHGTDLVEVHLFDGGPVDFGFGFGNDEKHPQRKLFLLGRQAGGLSHKALDI